MIEKLCQKAWGQMAPSAWKITARIKTGNWVFLIAILLPCARCSWSYYHRHAGHRDEIAEAFGSIGFLYGAPQTDHSGSRVIYLKTTEAGMGIFASDTATGKPQALFEDPDIEYPDVHDGVSPFSPDDTSFAYTFNSRGPAGYLAICEANSGKEIGRKPTPNWNVKEMAWLTPERLVCLGENGSAGAEHLYKLHLLQKQPDGKWLPWTDWFRKWQLTNASSLTVLSTNTFAWVDNHGLRSMNTLTNQITTLFNPKGGGISQMSYSRQTGEFLVTRKGRNDYSLWRLKLSTDKPDDFHKLTSDGDIRDAQWLNGGLGYG